MTTASNAKAIPFRFNRQLQILCGLFAIVFLASAIHPIMPEDWWVENGLVFVCVGLLIVTYRWLVFSELSYILIFLFLIGFLLLIRLILVLLVLFVFFGLLILILLLLL